MVIEHHNDLVSPPPEEDPLARRLLRGRDAPAGGLALAISTRLAQHRLGLSPPPTVGRYVLTRKLGEGGMGTVFLGHDPDLDRPIAIKVLNPSAEPLTQSQLAQEARALARLNHENVLIVHDVGTTDGQLWLAMEYIDGGTLSAWREANPDAGWVAVTRHALASARGLAAAHRAGVVHRDFKPDNVMMGSDGRVRVTDFGLAVIDGSHTDEASDAPGTPGVIAGTPVYLPPEVRAGAPQSAAGDQYSFFVALKELLTSHDSDAEAIPSGLAALLARGSDPDPAARWPSMDVVVERLERLLDAGPPDPHRQALLDRVRSIWRRSPTDIRPAPLDIEPVADAVDSPWRGVAPAGERTTARLRLELWRAHGSLLLLGGPGAGKTTALLGLLDDLLDRAVEDPRAPVPILLNLSSLAIAEGSPTERMVDELVTKYGLPRARARRWLEDDALVLLLDGLDEVPAGIRPAVIEAINAFRKEHPASVVIACRDHTYASIGVRLRLGAALRIVPPSAEVLEAVCAAHGATPTALPKALHGTSPDERPSPLLVALYLRGARDPDGTTAEGSAQSIYEAFVERALDRPPPLPTARRESLARGLGWLAAMMRRVATSDLWLERLQISWLPTRPQRVAAIAIAIALLGVIALSVNLAFNALAGRPPFVALLLTGMTVATALILNRGLAIRPRSALRWSWREALRKLPLMMTLGVGAGLLFGIFFTAWVNIVLCVAAGLALSVALGIEPRDQQSRLRPAQGLRQSLRSASLVGVATGLLAGAAVGYGAVSLVLPHVAPGSPLRAMEDPRLSLFLSASGFTGLVAALAYGGTAVILHAAVRIVIALRSPLPLRLATWLDRATDRGLLRRVGGGWMFLHDTLLDYFHHLAVSGQGRAASHVGSAEGPER